MIRSYILVSLDCTVYQIEIDYPRPSNLSLALTRAYHKDEKPSQVAFLITSGIHQRNKPLKKITLAFCDERLGFSFILTVEKLCSSGNVPLL